MKKTNDGYPKACTPPDTCGYCITCKETRYKKALLENPTAVWCVDSPCPKVHGAKREGNYKVDKNGKFISDTTYKRLFITILTSLNVSFKIGDGIDSDVFFIPLSERHHVLAGIMRIDKKPLFCLKSWIE